jgi:hypothetical protein
MGFTIKGSVIEFQPTEEETAKYAPIPEGEYPVCISEAEAESDEKGDRIQLRWCIDQPGSPFHERLIFDTCYINGRTVSAKAVEIGLEKLARIAAIGGIDTDKDLDSDMLCAKLIGLSAVAKVSQREYQGKTYNNVKSVKAPKAAKAAVKKVSVRTPF